MQHQYFQPSVACAYASALAIDQVQTLMNFVGQVRIFYYVRLAYVCSVQLMENKAKPSETQAV